MKREHVHVAYEKGAKFEYFLNRYMFVAVMMSSSKMQIDRMPMDGSLVSRRRFVETNFAGSDLKLYFDRGMQRLFWVDTTTGFVQSIGENG